MKDLLHNKFFLTIVAVTLALVILVPTVLSFIGFRDPVRAVISTVFSPVQRLFQAVTDAIDGFASYYSEFDAVIRENDALREELEALRKKIDDAEALASENDWLRAYIGIRDENPSFEMLPTTVIGRSAAGAPTVFTLDKGSAAGVREQMPVLTEAGIVGFVSEVGLGWCKVQTLLEMTSSIGVYLRRTGDAGILEGSYELAADGLCVLRYLPADADIEVGDSVLSSGFGTVYPRGLAVGRVVRVEQDPVSRSPVAYVEISADITSASRVMILLHYETSTQP